MHEGPPAPDEEQEKPKVPNSETQPIEEVEVILPPHEQLTVPGKSLNETKENIDRSFVIDSLRSQSPESEQLLIELILNMEARVGESFEERVGHIQDIAKLYREAGLYERAFYALNDAADMSYQEGHDDVCEQLEHEMTILKNEASRPGA